ncbi:MAG: ABC transporter ATP-binding protein [Alphaproteobacteria bacterium]|nr:ABC transporter ATP-binding protein [Alphaproteobacteria bacterium]
MPFLEIQGLVKRYGSVAAVDGVDLAVERGEFLSLLGPSGCGKSTTLLAIAGFVEPSAGSIRIDGREMAPVKPNRRNIGIVFQSFALFPHMTVAENVGFGLEMRRVSAAERGHRIAEALALVRLDELAGRYPKQLSGGQQQRVALARALVIRPDLLLLDEPMSSLDAKLREEMRVEIRDIQRRVAITTILVTHDQAEALLMADRVAVMDRGRIARIGRPYEVYEDPGSAFVSNFLGRTNLIAATVVGRSGGRLRLRVGEVEVDATGDVNGSTAMLSLRPERLSFGSDGVPGKVESCLFMGGQWLYRVATPIGELAVIRPNEGGAHVPEGGTVRVTWPPEAARVVHE